MTILTKHSLHKSMTRNLFIGGVAIVFVVTSNTSYACDLVCKDMKTALQECVWKPKGCNNKNQLDLPSNKLDRLTNPQLVNPQLINPKRQVVPGDQFNPKKIK